MFSKLRLWQIITSVVFGSFAIMQWNDPDPFLWTLVYGVVGLMALFYSNIRRSYIIILLFIYLIFFLSYVPSIVNWVKAGMPSITSSMKAESPFIELIREASGLVICIATLLIFWRKKSKSVT